MSDSSICEICNISKSSVYVNETEGFYCGTCYNKYKPQILCGCDGTCSSCEELNELIGD